MYICRCICGKFPFFFVLFISVCFTQSSVLSGDDEKFYKIPQNFIPNGVEGMKGQLRTQPDLKKFPKNFPLHPPSYPTTTHTLLFYGWYVDNTQKLYKKITLRYTHTQTHTFIHHHPPHFKVFVFFFFYWCTTCVWVYWILVFHMWTFCVLFACIRMVLLHMWWWVCASKGIFYFCFFLRLQIREKGCCICF